MLQGAVPQVARTSVPLREGRPRRGAAFAYAATVTICMGLVWIVSFAWWLLLPDSRIVPLDIPAGTAASIARGQAVDVIPTTLLLRRGDTLFIRNDDEVVHRLGYAAIAPGGTARIPVDSTLLDGPTLLCTIHPSGALAVSPLARPGIEATIIPTLIAGIPVSFAVVVAIMVIRRLGD